MRIAYATIGSATDLRAWSGLNRNILDAIRAQGVETAVIENLTTQKSLLHSSKARFYHYLLGKTYARDRDPEVARQWAAQVRHQLHEIGPVDCVVSPGSLAVAALPTEIPTAIWADATFHLYHTTYAGVRPLCRESIRAGDHWDRVALQNATLACFASEWAAKNAVEYYGADPQKVHTIPFGANCPPAYHDRKAATDVIHMRSRERCELLFIGVDWARKGGPLVLELAEYLKRSGVPLRLTIAGCNPFNGKPTPEHVECLGFLSRNQIEQKRKLDAAFRRAHFFVMPSLAECYGLVYAEASAYAVPSLARNVGGVGAVVHNGKNGWLFAPDASAKMYADRIASVWQDSELYAHTALSAYDEWERRLNWRVAGETFVSLLKMAVGDK